jgi:hypothetical protein
MNTGKCPHCKKTVDKARIEVIEPDTQATSFSVRCLAASPSYVQIPNAGNTIYNSCASRTG